MNEEDKLAEITEDVMHLVEGHRILDVGTGFGTVTARLLREDGTAVTSIDPEAWYFDSLRKKFDREIRDGRLNLMKVGIESIPFPDGFFDSSIAVCSLHHLSDPALGIKAMERVSARRIIVADWSPVTAGLYNPHSRVDLKRNKEAIKSYALNGRYQIEEGDVWFLVWK